MRLLLGLLNRIRPREGWLILMLTLAAALCAPAALMAATQAPDAVRLVWLTMLAALAGLGLARSRLAARQAAALGSLLGAGLIAAVLGGILPPLSLLWAELRSLGSWLQTWLGGTVPAVPPFTATGVLAWQRLVAFGERLSAWSQSVAGDGPVTDPIGFLLFMSLLAWAMGCFATWQVYRRRAPLAGLLPSGLAVSMVVFLTGSGRHLLLFYLFFTLGLLAAVGHWTRRQRWEQNGFDYPGDVGIDLGMVVLAWLFAAVILAAVFPYVRSVQISRSFWKVMDRPYSLVEQVTTHVFGRIEVRYPGGTGPGELPRGHLLAGGSNLGEKVVFRVTTSDPPPPPPEIDDPAPAVSSVPRRYWRSAVYDAYTGHGWEHGPLESRNYRGDQMLDVMALPGPELRQTFEIAETAPYEQNLYAVNQPLILDQPVQAWWQMPGDLAYVRGDARRYTVISRPSEPAISDLRAAPATLPPDVAERYLALPDRIPRRVHDLAVDIAGTATNRYDRATAIASYLRTYTYTLDLSLPPDSRDLVDYFLFDEKQGYCDYYASAMVVLARAAGIPARFATGYAQGTYDYQQRRWIVTEMDAHSWVEVYFEGIGWVEFEPTAAQPALQRPRGSPRGVSPAAPPPTAALPAIPWPLVALPALLAVLVGVVIAIWLPKRAVSMPPGELARDRYRRLVRWGYRLGRPPRAGETPFEYGVGLSAALRARGQSSRWSKAREAAVEAPGEVQELTEGYVRSQYARRPLDERDGSRLRTVWERLRRHLRWLLLR